MEATLDFMVTDADTAEAVGSGSLPVLGTPRLLAWCEAATCAAIDPSLPDGSTSVGTRVELEHRAASTVGAEVRVTASAVSASVTVKPSVASTQSSLVQARSWMSGISSGAGYQSRVGSWR